MVVPGGKRVLLGAIGAGLVFAPAGYLTAQYLAVPEVGQATPGPGAQTTSATPQIRLAVTHAGNLGSVKVLIDDADVSAAIRRVGGGFVITAPKLPDGQHTIELTAKARGLFGGAVRREWTIVVDTTKPRVRVASPAPNVWTTSRIVRGTAEPGAKLAVTWQGGQASLVVPSSGRWTVDPGTIGAGVHPFHVVATDAAGNTAGVLRRLRLDTVAPVLTVAGADGWVTDTDAPVITGTVHDRSPVTYRATLDGQAVKIGQTKDAWRLETAALWQGTHVLEVTATDAAGNTRTITHPFGIDSTETLSSNLTLGPGARGRDVRRLQLRLKLEGFWKGKVGRFYDARVKAAVAAYEQKHGMVPDGIARPALLSATYGKLIVYRHEFRVHVYRDGVQVATFPVAVGRPGFETPLGEWVIEDKIKDPTWVPPNSPWAAGLEPIPAGSSNPLGTRWIGTSAPAIGFHGTPEDWSVGSAASHGCMRMHMADVEKLYDLVQVGEAVSIRA